MKASGRQHNQEGQEQEAKGQVKDYVAGISDRATGTVGEAVANITGNKGAQTEYQKQHAAGKTTQRGAEEDILKQADAESGASGKS